MHDPTLPIALGILFCALGVGMIHATWVDPKSRIAPLLSARWRPFGPVSSKLGAAAQSAMLLSIGALAILTGLRSPFDKWALVSFVASAAMCAVARVADMGRERPD